MTDLHFGIITGLTLEENRQLATLAGVFNYHQPYNEDQRQILRGAHHPERCKHRHCAAGGIKKLEVGATGARKPWMCWLRAACLTVL